MPRYIQVTFTDELLTDGTVHRRFSTGRQEWRRRVLGRSELAEWQDDNGRRGMDESLAGRLIRRVWDDGRTQYGRDVGFGRTTWSGGTMTVNRTSFGGRFGALLTGIGAVALLGPALAPPDDLSDIELEQLRAERAARAGDSGGSGGGDNGDDGRRDDDWSDDDWGDDSDDFG